MGESDRSGGRGGLSGMIWNCRSGRLASLIFFLIISDFFAVFEDTATQVNILIVKFAHGPPLLHYTIYPLFVTINLRIILTDKQKCDIMKL